MNFSLTTVVQYTAVASFQIPTMDIVAESNSVLEVCVTMITTPSGVTLATDVNLTLTPISDTGKEFQPSSEVIKLIHRIFQLLLVMTFLK